MVGLWFGIEGAGKRVSVLPCYPFSLSKGN
uniref:Uncharacterized protein n=1 Tax=Rhizophora mucronata TaxID=61149 RepID=A0A2P2NKA9_RHIMU